MTLTSCEAEGSSGPSADLPWGPTYISDGQFLAVIHAGNGGLALRYEVVIGDVVGEQATFCA